MTYNAVIEQVATETGVRVFGIEDATNEFGDTLVTFHVHFNDLHNTGIDTIADALKAKTGFPVGYTIENNTFSMRVAVGDYGS